MFESFDFKPGRIKFNGYRIESNEEINSDNDSLTEDMFQVEYPGNYTIDFGWYSGIDKFIVYVIKDCDWQRPLIRKECSTLEELNEGMNYCIHKVRELF